MKIKSLFYIITSFFIMSSASAIWYEIDPGEIEPGKYIIKFFGSKRTRQGSEGIFEFSVPIESSSIHKGHFSFGNIEEFDNLQLTLWRTEFFRTNPTQAHERHTMLWPEIKDRTISVKLVDEDRGSGVKLYLKDKFSKIEKEKTGQ